MLAVLERQHSQKKGDKRGAKAATKDDGSNELMVSVEKVGILIGNTCTRIKDRLELEAEGHTSAAVATENRAKETVSINTERREPV